MLEVRSIASGYGQTQVLYDVSFSIGEREVVTLLGRNGMGKTTTIYALLGAVKLWSGDISFNGVSLRGMPPYKVAKLGIGLVPEGRQVFPTLSVRENLVATAANRREARDPWTLDKVLHLFPQLQARISSAANLLSGGEQQMLAIGRGLMAEPRLLILDEPSLGLSPLLVEEMFGLIGRLREQGLAVLLVEQNVGQSLDMADRAYVLENGQIRFAGLPAELLASETLRQAYLGM